MARLQETTAKPLMENRRIRLQPVYSFQTLGVSSKPEKRQNRYCLPPPSRTRSPLTSPATSTPLIQDLSDCFLFLMDRQAVFTCILGYKHLFVLNVHTLLLGIGAKMDGWLEGHPILTCLHSIDIFFCCYGCAGIACSVSINASLTAHLDHRWVFYFFGLQNRQSLW